jgi:hypothetical protein
MTTKKLVLLIVCVLLLLTSAMGQDQLVLKHKRKNKIKKLDLDQTFDIKTHDTTYVAYIIGFTDSTILIPTKRRTSKDTVYISSYTYRKYSKSTFFRLVLRVTRLW